MKLFKLYTHQKSFSADDLVLNPKEHPDARLHDVVEIFHPDSDGSDGSAECGRLLLQITGFNEELKGREIISVDSNIATAFNLRTYGDVIMRVVDPATVALDSVEITFKDQYMGRSEMWRLKKFLANTCVYANKKIEYCNASLRCQVYEMWAQGDRVSCGVITADTKVVFRSSTSMVYLFIQMSSEMWDFDIHGDLYFEKAVNGFLSDLFGKWKRMGSNHEVTIVLFSRTFYAARSLDEFPSYMRDCLQTDYRGRFYEDFYRVAIQNERNDDWSTQLVQLRRLFTSYPASVLRYHERPGVDASRLPVATNSTAAQGNFLEVLNISLNVFEKHYLDRSFDRTGQLSVVITPGVGVFEVDRELTNITKQRIIDNGVGSDLVCVGEQPLHAVPLLKFHNKAPSPSAADDYSMPHWINLSFYSTNKKVAYSTFVPRIKLPPLRTDAELGGGSTEHQRRSPSIGAKLNASSEAAACATPPTEYVHNSLFDYDAYDAQIFTIPPPGNGHGFSGGSRCGGGARAKKTSVPTFELAATVSEGPWDVREPTTTPSKLSVTQPIFRRKMSDPDIYHHGTLGGGLVMGSLSPGAGAFISESMSHLERQGVGSGGGTSPLPQTYASGSLGAMANRPSRALINPFAPSHVTIKLTSNRRRWTHIFPKGPSGVLIQQHHYQAAPARTKVPTSPAQTPTGARKGFGSGGLSTATSASSMQLQLQLDDEYVGGGLVYGAAGMLGAASSHENFGVRGEGSQRRKMPSPLYSAAGPLVTVEPSNSLTLLWGATGEQEWTPALTTGVDWKSLTIPACLPITTDYFPDKRALHNDYLVSDYSLLPDGVNHDYAQNRAIYRRPLNTEEVFAELISQRLAQGFQLIVQPDKTSVHPPPPVSPAQGGQPSPAIGCSAAAAAASAAAGGGPSKSLSIKLPTPTIFVGLSSPASTSTPQRPHGTSILQQKAAALRDTDREYLLSIGRIFHKIALVDTEITVTRFRPRHPYAPINIDYRYRFKAPQHDTYEVSGVQFKTDKLENFNWNFMDQYICTRGDADYRLSEHLKYWRFRMYLLPKEHPATKRIIDPNNDQPTERCDIYQDTAYAMGNNQHSHNHSPSFMSGHTGTTGGNGTVDPSRQYMEDFVRFLEIHMNKLKKLNCHKLARGSPTTQHSHLTRRRHSTSLITRPPSQSHASSTPSLSVRNNDRLAVSQSGTPVRSGSKVEKGQLRVSPASNNSNDSGGSSNAGESNLLMTSEDNEETFLTEAKLGCNATLTEIFEAMRHPVTGVCFVARAQSLPSNTFVLWDAINWLNAHVEGGVNAVEKLEAMRRAGLIGHASGKGNTPVVPGFYLYHICHQADGKPSAADYTPPLGDLQTFENEWMEVEIPLPVPHNPNNSSSPTSSAVAADIDAGVPQFLRECVDVGHCDGPIYKQAHLEIDAQQKSDRIEWGHVRYHRLMRSTHAFEIVTQWLTASGPIVYDLVYVWMRKAQQCGFQLVPVPADPLAEPFTEKSDPLRGPIFVPLNVGCLEAGGGQPLFKEFRTESWPDRLLMLQECILQRFGFLGCYAETRIGSNEATLDRQYVHCSGNMFVLVASPHEELKARKRLASGGTSALKKPTFLKRPLIGTVAGAGGVAQDAYVTRHVTVQGSREEVNVPRKIGFLWSWNHMIANKKWKSLVLTNSPDAELFQLRMLQDFKDFCANRDDRLLRYWENSWAAKENACAARDAK